MNKSAYQERLEKAASHFRSIKTPETKDKSDLPSKALVQKATVAAINEILSGLSADLTAIMKSDSSDVLTDVDNAFVYAGSGVRRVFGMKAIKEGSAGWLTYAMKGLQEPQEKEKETWISGELGEK